MPLLHRHREKVVCCVTFERLEKWHLCETMAGIAYGGLQLLSCVVCTSCCVGEEKRQVRPVSIPFSPFSVQSRPILEVPTSKAVGIVMALGALVCWGSWSVTLVLATKAFVGWKGRKDAKRSQDGSAQWTHINISYCFNWRTLLGAPGLTRSILASNKGHRYERSDRTLLGPVLAAAGSPWSDVVPSSLLFLVVTSAMLLVTGALLVVTKKLLELI